jgi:hypothetical protein
MRVTRLEPVDDAPSRLVEHGALPPDRPLAPECPFVKAQAVRELIIATLLERGGARRCELRAALVADVLLGRTQPVPVGLSLHPGSVCGNQLALDAEQPLDDLLGSFVASLAEVVIPDDPFPVDEVERRPVVVAEGRPDRATGYSMARSLLACRTRLISCSNENSGVWTPITTSPLSR